MHPIPERETIFIDKIYSDFSFFDEEKPAKILTPRKKSKGETGSSQTKGKKTDRDLYLLEVISKIRQAYRIFF